MTEIKEILARLEKVESELKRLKSEKAFSPDDIARFEKLPPTALVGKDYVAWRFKCTEYAVVRKQSGTKGLRRVSKKPLKFVKREVDEAFARMTKPAKVLAAKFSAEGKEVKRRKSIIPKKAA